MSTILIVDDDTAHRAMLRTLLKGWSYTVEEADDGTVAVEKVRQTPYDAVLMDIRMVKMGGIEALREIKGFNPAIPVLIMTAYSSVETAVEALKIGAYDYLTKPLDFDVLKHTLDRMLDHTRLAVENRTLRERLEGRGPQSMIGKSAAMLELTEMILTVAPTDATVLISGESGTGKELVANAIHAGSERAAKPFVAVNCAALTETLLESELFGHEKGAFTGADKRREGRFMHADGGTLFLDEIGEIPLALQSKLLRAVQQGEVQRVGSDTVIRVNVRVIAATNRDLYEEVQAGNFREDLYYRLNVIGLRVPALRERRDDIPLLADFFLRRFAEKNRKAVKGATPQAMDALVRHDWPGNVRELENAMERAVIMATGEYITLRELPRNLSDAPLTDVPISADGEPALAGLSLDELERRAIMATLKECGDNKSEAARRLGITRATLHNKLKRYGME
ncbi:sigma-54 dependent transcriptional regulator [Desulfovibrio mangrovi]|uniref:sigma-54-dependent transcriptional regulator n=1 Tax=Desulfovibrio mangrovi TaxID=2976983 RepID=UPI0022486B06|nr:sigma-54 dependent transcriptional regulator [Desulfovibrio mangrovi]UZP66353.1 sigma-54 dependent transcriptional regulator [Desulfovibrio mangrovi]